MSAVWKAAISSSLFGDGQQDSVSCERFLYCRKYKTMTQNTKFHCLVPLSTSHGKLADHTNECCGQTRDGDCIHAVAVRSLYDTKHAVGSRCEQYADLILIPSKHLAYQKQDLAASCYQTRIRLVEVSFVIQSRQTSLYISQDLYRLHAALSSFALPTVVCK